MEISSVRINSQYRITLPKWALRQLKISSGDHLLVDVQDGLVTLLPLHQGYTPSLAGLHGEIWADGDEYLVRERSAWIDSTEHIR